MPPNFQLIAEDFEKSLNGISKIIEKFRRDTSPETRVNLSYALTLLLSSVFEKCILEMAQEYAKNVVESTNDILNIPPSLVKMAWEKTFFTIRKNKPDLKNYDLAKEIAHKAKEEINTLYNFIQGDIKQEISYEFIKNENHMRTSQINRLFQISGLNNVCSKACNFGECDKFFGDLGPEETHRLLDSKFNEFFKHRNNIAHSLKNANSLGPNEFDVYLKLFKAFSKDLCSTLEQAICLRVTGQDIAL